MNPSIEVQITARLDRLDAALNVAQAKVQASAATMGKAGEAAGSQFVDNLLSKMAKGLAMGAITQVLGGGILTALKGVNAGKGGEEIGLDIAKGIVDGAKGIPIVGIFVSIFDEIVNGFDRIVDAQFKSMLAKTQAFSDAIAGKMVSTAAAAQDIENKLKVMDATDAKDPLKLAEVNKQIKIQAANDRLQAIQDEKQATLRAFLDTQKAKKESIDKEEESVSATGAALRAMGVGGDFAITSFEGTAEEEKAKIDKDTERGRRALQDC